MPNENLEEKDNKKKKNPYVFMWGFFYEDMKKSALHMFILKDKKQIYCTKNYNIKASVF